MITSDKQTKIWSNNYFFVCLSFNFSLYFAVNYGMGLEILHLEFCHVTKTVTVLSATRVNY